MEYTAQVVLINPEGLVLGVSRKNNHDDFGLPGGKMEAIDNGEPKFTAIREAFEETGLQISNLRLVFAMHKDGYMGHCYMADYKGEINHNEPHLVKWLPFETLIKGSFGKYNTLVAESLKNMGIDFVKEAPLDGLEQELRVCVNEAGYLFSDLRRTTNWLGTNITELTFKNSDGSYIDENFYDFSLVNKVNELSSKYGVRVTIPSDYFPK
jgi:ADP-ribose pyrophosphatase YjhB (NUDIX family)